MRQSAAIRQRVRVRVRVCMRVRVRVCAMQEKESAPV